MGKNLLSTKQSQKPWEFRFWLIRITPIITHGERGANEKMNGLIRQYARKGSSFDDLTEDAVRQIQELLNNRPRKSLGYLTPKEYALLNFGISI